MLNLPQEAVSKIRPLLPEWAYYQPLEVFRTGFPPPDTDIASMAWLRPIKVEYPDDTLLLQEPVLSSGGPRAIPGNNLEDFMTGHGYSWVTTALGSNEPPLGVYRHINATMNDYYGLDAGFEHIVHIRHGGFMVHLVAKRGDDDFEDWADSLHSEFGVVPVFVGHIRADGGPGGDHLGAATSSVLGRSSAAQAFIDFDGAGCW